MISQFITFTGFIYILNIFDLMTTISSTYLFANKCLIDLISTLLDLEIFSCALLPFRDYLSFWVTESTVLSSMCFLPIYVCIKTLKNCWHELKNLWKWQIIHDPPFLLWLTCLLWDFSLFNGPAGSNMLALRGDDCDVIEVSGDLKGRCYFWEYQTVWSLTWMAPCNANNLIHVWVLKSKSNLEKQNY